MARRIVIFIAALLAILGIGVSAVLIWVTSESGSRFISKELRSTIRKNTGLEITFTQIGLDIFPPRIRVQGIDARDDKGEIACKVDEAELTPDWLQLFSRVLAIEELYLGSPSCDIRVGSETLSKLVFAEKKSDKPFKLDISALPEFEVFAVSDAAFKLEIDDPGRLGAVGAEMNGFGLDVTQDEQGIEIRGLIDSFKGEWRDGDKRVAEQIGDLQFRAALSEDGLDVRHLAMKIAGGDLSLQDAHVPLPVWPSGPDVADLSIQMPLDVLNRLPLGLPKLQGKVGYFGQVSAKQETDGEVGVYARGRAQLTGIRAGELVLGDLEGLVSFTPKGVAFDETELKAADGVLGISGNIAFDEQLTTELSLNLNRIELAHLLEQVTLPGTYVTQRMTGPVKLKGQLNPLRLSGNVRVDVRDHTVLTGPFRDKRSGTALYVEKTLAKGQVIITDQYFEGKNLEALTGDTRVAVNMKINYDSLDWYLNAKSQDFHLGDLKKIMGFEVGGHGPVVCNISGKLNNPQIKGQGSFKEALLEGMRFDHVSTEVTFKDLILSFGGLSAKRGTSRVSASELAFDFNAKGGLLLNTKIEAEQVAIEELMDLFEIDGRRWGSPTGVAYGRVAVSYNLEPEQLIVSADVVHDGLEVFGERFGTDVVRLTWNNGTLIIDEAGVTKGRGTISVTGAVRSDQSISFIALMSGVELGSIDYQPLRELGVEAVGQAFVVIEGSLEHPVGTADLRLGKLTHRRKRYGPSDLSLRIDGPVISGSGKVAGEQITLEHLSLNLSRESFEVEGFAKEVDLVPLLGLESMGRKPALTVTGDLALKGRFATTLHLNGRAELMKVRAKIGDFEFENKKKARIRVKANEFNISPTPFSGRDVDFELSGLIGFDALNLKVKGNADLVSVSSMVDGVTKTGGNLDFELRASGALSHPSFRGEAALADGFLKIAKFPHPVTNIRGRATFSPKIIRMYDFAADSASGTLAMTGEIGLEDGRIRDYRFNLQAYELVLTPFEDLTFKVSTVQDGLTLTSGARGGLPKITGDAEVKDLRYTEDIRILEVSDLNIDRLSGTKTRATKPKLIDPAKDFFAFDIRLHGEENLEAHNNLFDVDVVIDDLEKPLRFVGTNQNFGFLGRILGKRGRVRFAGRRFNIKYAAVDFRDADRINNPNFQVIADGQIRDWKVTMTAEGTIEEYEIKFASQPFLAKEDIAFLILTGMTQAENRQFGGSGLNLGMPFLGQFGPGGGELPVELQVYTEYSDSAGTDTTRIAMGRWINEDVWVSVSSGVGQTRDVEAQVDYKISDELSVSAGYEEDDEGSTGNVGLDLKFRLEF